MQKLSLSSRIGVTTLILIAFSFLAQSSRAQTGPELLIKPWPETTKVDDGTTDAYLFQGGHTTSTDNSFRLEEYESSGRFRILPGNEISPRVGYSFTFLDNHTSNPRLPDQLSDESLAFGTGIAKYQGWIVAVSVAAGYAGSDAFGEGKGWYGKADLVLAKEINDKDAIGIILDYDGHRNYLPDTPLPGIGFSHRFDPKLAVVAGLPYSMVDWKPIDHLELKGEYNLYTDLKASISYEFIKGWSVYGTYGYIRDAFEVDGLAHDHRLLFYQRRAELGVQYAPCANFTMKVGLGYGWDGSYRSGFDFRKDQLVADITDEPFLRGGLEWKF